MSKETKQITFEGREYTVPVWVEWVAKSNIGAIFGYVDHPKKGEFEFINVGRFVRIEKDLAVDETNWRDSLTKV
jgi:predicted branched-subunit amino acid permease